MGCLYYIPARRFPGLRVPDVLKARRLSGEGPCLEDFGLGHLDGASLHCRPVRGAGPDGGAGLTLGLGLPASETGHFPETQEWRPVDGGALYVGWKTGARPGPETFLRKDALPGTSPVKLADGQVWEFTPSSALPEVMTYSPGGELVFVPRGCDAAHFAACEWLMGYVLEGGAQPYAEIVERVVVCLQARYHLGLFEFLALGLFTTDLNTRIVFAALGLDYEEVVHGKKNEDPSGSDTSSGLPGDCPG